MKHKRFIALITFCVIYPLAHEKPSELPPLHPHNIVDPEVQKFLQDELGVQKHIQRKKFSRDLLGRLKKFSSSRNLYYVAREDIKRLDVNITDIDYRNSNEPTITGRYEIDKDGNTQIWLNEEKIKAEEYEKKSHY